MRVQNGNFFESLPGFGPDLSGVAPATPLPGATYMPSAPASSSPAVPPNDVVFATAAPMTPATPAVPPTPARLPDLGLFMSGIGITDPDSRAEMTAQIYSFAFEVGIAKITPQLTAVEKASAARIIREGPINGETFTEYFQGPTREPALEEAFHEALEVVTEVANRQAQPSP